jgi:hypothetical protein
MRTYCLATCWPGRALELVNTAMSTTTAAEFWQSFGKHFVAPWLRLQLLLHVLVIASSLQGRLFLQLLGWRASAFCGPL